MREEDLLEMIRAKPFAPFLIHVSDGSTFEVRHPEMIKVGRTKALVFFNAPDRDPASFDTYQVVALVHMTRFEPLDAVAAQ